MKLYILSLVGLFLQIQNSLGASTPLNNCLNLKIGDNFLVKSLETQIKQRFIQQIITTQPVENLQINMTKSEKGMTLQTKFIAQHLDGTHFKVVAYQGIFQDDIKTEIRVIRYQEDGIQTTVHKDSLLEKDTQFFWRMPSAARY